MTTKNDEELIHEALALLSQEPPTTIGQSPETETELAEDDSTSESSLSEEGRQHPLPRPPQLTPPGPPSVESPTLAALEATRRPQQKTACEVCPNSVWFSSPKEVKCYCRVMYLVAWSSQEPNQITHCDGRYLGREE